MNKEVFKKKLSGEWKSDLRNAFFCGFVHGFSAGQGITHTTTIEEAEVDFEKFIKALEETK